MSLEFYHVLVIEQIAFAATWMCLISSVLEVGCRLVLVSGTCNVSRIILALNYFIRALIWYWDHLKNFIAEIPHGHLGMSIGTIWVTQKRFQGPPARGF